MCNMAFTAGTRAARTTNISLRYMYVYLSTFAVQYYSATLEPMRPVKNGTSDRRHGEYRQERHAHQN